MRKLFIYYSLTGSGEVVAKKMEENGFELRKVIEKKKMPKKFFFMVLVGGFRAGMAQKGKLIDYNNDVSSFDEVVIGSPIWNGRLTPAINSVLAQTDFSNKKLSFVFYSGSGQGKSAQKKVNKLFPDAKVVFLKEPKKYEKELEKLGNL
jgi:flavodoxin